MQYDQKKNCERIYKSASQAIIHNSWPQSVNKCDSYNYFARVHKSDQRQISDLNFLMKIGERQKRLSHARVLFYCWKLELKKEGRC